MQNTALQAACLVVCQTICTFGALRWHTQVTWHCMPCPRCICPPAGVIWGPAALQAALVGGAAGLLVHGALKLAWSPGVRQRWPALGELQDAQVCIKLFAC